MKISLIRAIKVGCLLLTSFGSCLSGKSETSTPNSIKDSIELSNALSMSGFNLLDSVVENYDVFIVGENHTYLESNSQLWVKMIKYLHQNAGVKTVMIEYGHASGWLINKYIHTGDSALFKVLKDYAFKEYADSYKAIMEYNKTLPEEDQIDLVGIDLERGVYSAVKVLSMLIPENKQPHDSIDLHIESILGLAMYQDRELFNSSEEESDEDSDDISFYGSYSISSTMDLVIENFNNHPEKYQELLDTNFAFFQRTIKGLEMVRKWKGLENDNTVQDYIFREKYMYNRFVEEYESRGGKFFGQFGRCHSTKKMADKNACNWFRFKSFANRLEQSPTLNIKNKILTMGILYQDDDYSNNDWAKIQDKVDSLFLEMDDNRLMIYDLKNDSELLSFFEEDFNYVMLNTTRPSKDHPYLLDEFEYDYDSDFRGKIAYSYGNINIDLGSINELLENLNIDGYPEVLTLHAIEFTNSSNALSNWVQHSYLGWIRGVTRELSSVNNSVTSSKLNGIVINSYSFYNLLPKAKFLDIMGGFSLGYSRLAMTIERQLESTGAITSGFLGDKSISKYTNPAFTVGLAGLIDLNFGNFTIGGMTGYQLDLSKNNWRADGLLDGGPETSLSGLYSTLRIGFNFGS